MHIALVDPSRTTRLIVSRMLEARGHEVVPFSDELDALAQIRTDPCIDALITSAELKHIGGRTVLGDTAARHLPASDLCADDVQPIRSAQPDRGAGFRRRRFHRQAAFGRGAWRPAARRGAHPVDAARVASSGHHRSADRAMATRRSAPAPMRRECKKPSPAVSAATSSLCCSNESPSRKRSRLPRT